MRTVLFVALGLALLLAWPANGQSDGADADIHIEMPKAVVSAMRPKGGQNVRMVDFTFQIKRLRDGAFVTDVPKEEILVEEDGQRVKEFTIYPPRANTLTVVFAMDVSGSMARSNKIQQAKQAALAFLKRLDPRADVGLILFDHQIQVAEPPVRDASKQQGHRDKLMGLVEKAEPAGGTAYLDATVRAVQMLKDVPGQRAVIVMTDGVDMNSKETLESAIQAAVIGEVPVYTVGIGDPGKNDPVTTVLVLDRSGSMAGKADAKDELTKIVALREAAKRFVGLMRRSATTTLLPFASAVDTPEPFTNNKDLLRRRIDALTPRDGTSLYDATDVGVKTLVASGVKGRKAVVVLTDGKDESPGSRRSDEEVIERAKEAGVPLYMLGLGQAYTINEPVMKKMAAQTGGEYYHAGNQQKLLEVFEHLSIQLHDDGIDEDSLRELATKTGGRYTHIKDVSQLQFLYESLAEELQSMYRVTFESRRSSHDGTARGIDVKIVRGGRVISQGSVDDVARGVVVPQMSAVVYLGLLAGLAALLAAPGALRRMFRTAGGT